MLLPIVEVFFSLEYLSGAADALALPPDVVNDDFCDCADGSDEPGTNACAGQSETLFYCWGPKGVDHWHSHYFYKWGEVIIGLLRVK